MLSSCYPGILIGEQRLSFGFLSACLPTCDIFVPVLGAVGDEKRVLDMVLAHKKLTVYFFG